MIVWFPRVTSGASLFVWPGAAPTSAGAGIPFIVGAATGTIDNTKWLTGFEQYYANYFTQT